MTFGHPTLSTQSYYPIPPVPPSPVDLEEKRLDEDSSSPPLPQIPAVEANVVSSEIGMPTRSRLASRRKSVG